MSDNDSNHGDVKKSDDVKLEDDYKSWIDLETGEEIYSRNSDDSDDEKREFEEPKVEETKPDENGRLDLGRGQKSSKSSLIG